MTSIRQLRFLAALSETRNFSRAAEMCHVTQSTLSTGLKELEQRLGVQVAERSKHSVMMTPVGEDLADRARDLLARVKDFEDRAQRESAAGITLLRLGTIPTIGPYLMPRAMPMLRKALPDMKLYLREETDRVADCGTCRGQARPDPDRPALCAAAGDRGRRAVRRRLQPGNAAGSSAGQPDTCGRARSCRAAIAAT